MKTMEEQIKDLEDERAWQEIFKELRANGFGVVEGTDAVRQKIKEIGNEDRSVQ